MYVDKSEGCKTRLGWIIFFPFQVECESVAEICFACLYLNVRILLDFLGVKSLITLNRISFKSSTQILAGNFLLTFYQLGRHLTPPHNKIKKAIKKF